MEELQGLANNFSGAGVIALAYSFAGIVRGLLYVPQIIAVWRDQHGAQSTSILTWTGFSIIWILGILFGWIVIDSMPVVWVNIAGATGSSLVLYLACLRRYQYRCSSKLSSAQLEIKVDCNCPAANESCDCEKRFTALPVLPVLQNLR